MAQAKKAAKAAGPEPDAVPEEAPTEPKAATPKAPKPAGGLKSIVKEYDGHNFDEASAARRVFRSDGALVLTLEVPAK